MTVCIGAICDSGIVTASDRLLTWGHSASETALKAARIAPRWITMIAGDDVTMVDDVIRSARETLAVEERGNPTVAQVEAAIFGAWRDAQNKLAEAQVLNPYRMTVSDFTKNGRSKFGEAQFLELAQRIQQASNLGCQLLVAGIHQHNIPCLLVTDDGALRDYTRADFVAIGSGHMAAVASLAVDGYNRQRSMTEAVYHVCAAKFMAEASRAPGVGEQSLVLCMNDDGRTKWIFNTQIESIRALWKAHGRPRVPDEDLISETIAPILTQQQWIDV